MENKMKNLLKICLVAVMSFMVVAVATAQPKDRNIVYTEFIADFDLKEVKKIKDHFKDVKGVRDVDIDLKKKIMENTPYI